MRILVTGAAGSGTSTLAKAFSDQLQANFIEADDVYWLETSPPFVEKRPSEEREQLMMSKLESRSDVVVSGSVMGWGDRVENAFDVVIFLYVETSIRLERLRRREARLFGAADPAFLDWAAQYDEGTAAGRSLGRHLEWLEKRSCRVVKLEGAKSVPEQLDILSQKGVAL